MKSTCLWIWLGVCAQVALGVSPLWAASGESAPKEEGGEQKEVTPIKLKNLPISVIQNEAVVAYVVMEIDVLPTNAEKAAELEGYVSLMKDVILKDLHGVLGALWLPGFEATPEFIQARVDKALGEAFPPGWIKKTTIIKLTVSRPKVKR